MTIIYSFTSLITHPLYGKKRFDVQCINETQEKVERACEVMRNLRKI